MAIRKTLILAASLLTVVSSQAFAQTASNTVSATPGTSAQKLTPEQRQQKRAEMKQKWESMTPEEKAKAKADHQAKRQERYDNATPEQKAKMDAHKQAWEAKHPNAGKGDSTVTPAATK